MCFGSKPFLKTVVTKRKKQDIFTVFLEIENTWLKQNEKLAQTSGNPLARALYFT